ncbi:MAG TPA: exodeoxyribonuclease VII small subunit [Acidimicrobiales bacterium]
MADSPSDAGTVSYADAVIELRTILDELEHDDVDVDRLAERVARASALIESCRARIESARVDVERVVLDMEDDAGDS